MSTWRNKAKESLPGLRVDVQRASLYQVFFDLRNAVCNAHKAKDEHQLKNIYGFAEWCYRHTDMWNAAGVAFYEHLGDDDLVRREFPRYVPHSIYREIEPLLAVSLSSAQLYEIQKVYNRMR